MYGKLIDGKLVKAPNVISVDSVVYYQPSAGMLISQGYKEIIEEPYPEIIDGEDKKYYIENYIEENDKIIKKWKETALAPDVKPQSHNADISETINELRQAIISLGGNV